MSGSQAKPKVVLGVSGGIAAYKAAELLRRLTESGHEVTVVPTKAALEFVGAATWAALSNKPVSSEVWDDVANVPHVKLGQTAQLVIVAPATADIMAKAAHGQANDLLTNTLLTARCPVIFAPAMHTEMWEHPATQANVATLRSRGNLVMSPASGRLTGTDTGKGRLPEAAEIFEYAVAVLAGQTSGYETQDMAGLRVVVTAGGTREPLDPVRFLSNKSSGLQGFALAKAAVARGAEVELIAANTTLLFPAGVEVTEVVTTAELRTKTLAAANGADAVVMAAAPADFRPAEVATSKIKKQENSAAPALNLVQNPDILAELVAAKTARCVVGFAAETGDAKMTVMQHGAAKLARKGCDLLVVNDVSAGKVFGSELNEAVILTSGGGQHLVPQTSKLGLANQIWDQVLAKLD